MGTNAKAEAAAPMFAWATAAASTRASRECEDSADAVDSAGLVSGCGVVVVFDFEACVGRDRREAAADDDRGVNDWDARGVVERDDVACCFLLLFWLFLLPDPVADKEGTGAFFFFAGAMVIGC
jgi:hypothetical protein